MLTVLTAAMYAVSGVAVALGAVLLAVAVVVMLQPRWYRRRWGRPREGRVASFNSTAFTLSQGRKHSWLYLIDYAPPYDDLVTDPVLGEAANEAWLEEQERRRRERSATDE